MKHRDGTGWQRQGGTTGGEGTEVVRPFVRHRGTWSNWIPDESVVGWTQKIMMHGVDVAIDVPASRCRPGARYAVEGGRPAYNGRDIAHHSSTSRAGVVLPVLDDDATAFESLVEEPAEICGELEIFNVKQKGTTNIVRVYVYARDQ